MRYPSGNPPFVSTRSGECPRTSPRAPFSPAAGFPLVGSGVSSSVPVAGGFAPLRRKGLAALADGLWPSVAAAASLLLLALFRVQGS